MAARTQVATALRVGSFQFISGTNIVSLKTWPRSRMVASTQAAEVAERVIDITTAVGQRGLTVRLFGATVSSILVASTQISYRTEENRLTRTAG
jgi:hypothetical protein